MIRNALIALSLVFVATAVPAQAQQAAQIDCSSIDATKYDADQIAQIKNICKTPAQELKEEAKKVTPDDVRNWASLGREFSTAVIETAKGLGVAVNEFVYTPVGIMIAFYFMWDKIGGILVGIPLLFAIWFGWRAIFNIIRNVKKTYETKPILFGLMNKRYLVQTTCDEHYNDNQQTAMWFVTIGAVLLSALDVFILIF